MSNSYFQFKDFIINQEKAAMKVCTDGCLFGAWVADTIKSRDRKIENILDIGTGTGLLALMLAQKSGATINAVEINESAAQQAKENFQQSKYKERLQLILGDIREMQLSSTYDLIISNPPFYENDLRSENPNRNDALHSAALSFEELIQSAKKLLSKKGVFAVLLPFSRAENFILRAEKHNLAFSDRVNVSQTENHSYFRCMLLLSWETSEIKKSDMVIKDGGKYSEEFTRLLQDYYLYL